MLIIFLLKKMKYNSSRCFSKTCLPCLAGKMRAFCRPCKNGFLRGILLVSAAVSLLNASVAENFLLAEDIFDVVREEPAVVFVQPGELQLALDNVSGSCDSCTRQSRGLWAATSFKQV